MPDSKDDALDSVALVRSALTQEHRDPETVSEDIVVLLDDRDPGEIIALLWRVTELAASLLTSWHGSIVTITPPEAQSEILTPEELLDSVVKMIVESDD